VCVSSTSFSNKSHPKPPIFSWLQPRVFISIEGKVIFSHFLSSQWEREKERKIEREYTDRWLYTWPCVYLPPHTPPSDDGDNDGDGPNKFPGCCCCFFIFNNPFPYCIFF
jgi:hypothetical protein